MRSMAKLELTLAMSMRAMRRYTADPVPSDDLSRILFVASRAPSGSRTGSPEGWDRC